MNQLHWQNNRNTNNYRLLFAHLDNRQLRHVEVSGDVRADHRFKVLGCVFRERFWDINAGIVDEEINALEGVCSRNGKYRTAGSKFRGASYNRITECAANEEGEKRVSD
jgi:hypothetical protein